MKELSWEKFNNLSELERMNNTEGSDDEGPGIIFGQLANMGNVNNYDDYNLYIAHTNFRITVNIVNFLCDVEGVESVDILSPYRFKVSVGKLFEPDTVLNHIKDNLTRE